MMPRIYSKNLSLPILSYVLILASLDQDNTVVQKLIPCEKCDDSFVISCVPLFPDLEFTADNHSVGNCWIQDIEIFLVIEK